MANSWFGVTAASILLMLPLGTAFASQVTLDASLAQSTLEANKQQTVFLKVGLTGFELATDKQRPPVNVALVLDKSGSMAGEKLERAKEAAVSVLERLSGSDIVSVVAYDSTVSVIVPSTKLSDRQAVIEKIRQIGANGSTALFAGVGKGAEELRKFIDKERVNRVILLSDGLANVGPQSPSELGELGASLAKEGITVSTIGLGLDYNEDLMTKLAAESNGNHVFVEQSSDLVAVFNREFQDVLSVVAQEVVIQVQCRDKVRPVRVLNMKAEITGQSCYVKMNQLYSKQEKYFILEVELPPRESGADMEVAEVSVTYTNMQTNTEDRLSSVVAAKFTADLAMVEQSMNKMVMEQCVLQLANLQNAEATLLRDQGAVRESRQKLTENALFLERNASILNSETLLKRASDNRDQADAVERNDAEWRRGRKVMRAQQYSDAYQQAPR